MLEWFNQEIPQEQAVLPHDLAIRVQVFADQHPLNDLIERILPMEVVLLDDGAVIPRPDVLVDPGDEGEWSRSMKLEMAHYLTMFQENGIPVWYSGKTHRFVTTLLLQLKQLEGMTGKELNEMKELDPVLALEKTYRALWSMYLGNA